MNDISLMTSSSYQQSSSRYFGTPAVPSGSYQLMQQQQQPAVLQTIQAPQTPVVYRLAAPAACQVANQQLQCQPQAEQVQLIPAPYPQQVPPGYPADQLNQAGQRMQFQQQQQQTAAGQLLPSQLQPSMSFAHQTEANAYPAAMDLQQLQQQQLMMGGTIQEPILTYTYGSEVEKPTGYAYGSAAMTFPSGDQGSYGLASGASMLDASGASAALYGQDEFLPMAGSAGMIVSQDMQGSQGYPMSFGAQPQQVLATQPSGSSIMSSFTGVASSNTGQLLFSSSSELSIDIPALSTDGTFVAGGGGEFVQGYGLAQETLGGFPSQQVLDGSCWQN
jgi:hypothetical protein